ncbi:MAG: hypothetical protein KAT77_01440 [Nanoarchaeota archaeon]|nr:hypothetical protein [Nanoarchaeota archaeon]
MKLNPKGDKFLGEMTELDERIMKVQYQLYDQGLNIWGEEGCDRCGACCYAWGVESVKEKFEPCEHADSSDCELHEDGKPVPCQAFKCYGFDYRQRGSDLQRYQLMLVAVEILKSRTPEAIQKVAQTPIKKRAHHPPKAIFENQVQEAFSKAL